MGGIMRDIRKLSQTIIVDDGSPQQGAVLSAGGRTHSRTQDRRYTCGCGYSEERDRKAAHSILQEGIKILVEAETAGLTELAQSVYVWSVK
ncbi:MAG: hypothetical protein LBO67_07270 [Spirochaetaceae bacterium]|jgi:hypothetical protein|nr:hypothetical protein [Spirochaetaceae bacterium]